MADAGAGALTGLGAKVFTLGRRFARARTPGVAPALIGHSHTKAIFDAAEQAGTPLRGFNFWTAPQPAMNPERTSFHPEISAVLAQGPVFSAVGGAAHNVLAMIRHPRTFDFVLPERPELPLSDGAEILPFGAVRATMAAAVREYLDIIGLVRRTATGPVFHLQAPPPLEDGARILDDVPWAFFQGLSREVAPAALRWKCWRLHSTLVEAFCARQGVAVLPAPDGAKDAKGYLRPEHYHDAMHVNARYGALVLDQMRRVL